MANCAAKLAKFRGGDFAFAAQFLFDLGLDRQAVAIPTGHVGRVVARHAFGLDDQVFQDFVEAGAEMNGSRRIGRAVMQHEERLALAGLQNSLVEVGFFPGGELFRLVLRQAGLHGKIGFRQVESFLQFEWFGHELRSGMSPFYLRAVLILTGNSLRHSLFLGSA